MVVLSEEVAQRAHLAQVRRQHDHVVGAVALLSEVLDAAQHHLGLELVPLALLDARLAPLPQLPVRVLAPPVVDKHNAISQPPDRRPVGRVRPVAQVRVRQLAREPRDLTRHAVLRAQRRVERALLDESLEERAVQVEAFAGLDRERVVVDLWPQLLVVADQHELLDRRRESRENVRLEDLAGLLDDDGARLEGPDQRRVLGRGRGRAAQDRPVLQDLGLFLAELRIEFVLDVVVLAMLDPDIVEALFEQRPRPPIVVRLSHVRRQVPDGFGALGKLVREDAGPVALYPPAVEVVGFDVLVALALSLPAAAIGGDPERVQERELFIGELQVLGDVFPLGRQVQVLV